MDRRPVLRWEAVSLPPRFPSVSSRFPHLHLSDLLDEYADGQP